MILRLSAIFFFIFILATAANSQTQEPSHTIFFIGDAGEPFVKDSPLGKILRQQVQSAGQNSTVIFLGDNIYPKGMPDANENGRKRAEEILRTQVNWIAGLEAQAIFIPGNHDWHRGGKEGWEYILHQQQWIDSIYNKRITFLPRGGCPGPVEVPLSENAVLIIIDSQWLLHPYGKPGEESECEAKTSGDVLAELSNTLQRHYNKRVILAAHHPLITYGEHGGVFTLKHHIFPLTSLSPKLYIPLPVVGSLFPVYRKLFGNIQDTAHPQYKEYSRTVLKMINEYPGTVYASGHEHALQHIVKDSIILIGSGSGAKTTSVKKKKYSRFADDVTGFAVLKIQGDGSGDISYWQVDDTVPEGKIVFQDEIQPLKEIRQPEEISEQDFSDKTVRVKASDQYSAGSWRKKFLGANYRAEWGQEIEVPVFDIGTEHGGLKIVQKGGGMQTLSLRLAAENGHEYVLRSVEKYPENAVPEMLRKTFAQDLVQDQISAAHPYAALVVSAMAEAADVYHTNPKLVYIPDDPRFGMYRKDFANTLALFEERPDEDWSDKAFFGNSGNIISTTKVLEKLAKDNDNRVDQKFVLRSRLFDMVIGDWDRHDDQWRWASFEDKDGDETYKPIPRDRDQTFFVNEGILPKFWSRRWALPKFEGFDDEINWPSGLSFNARYFDRSFLTEPAREDWINAAKDLQQKLSDDVIREAIKKFPKEIYDLNGEEIIRKLIARRDRLVEYAVEHYEFLARAVDVVGSDKKERFEVEWQANGDAKVQMFKITKEGEKGKKLYERVFKSEETKEVRLFGLGGDDQFEIDGKSDRNILIRIIGGNGQDSIDDDSEEKGKVLLYDRTNSFTIKSRGSVKERTSSNPTVNEYNRKAFQYDRLAPLLFGNFNPDDGLFIGGGFLYQTHGFRKDPFKQRHVVLASFAPRTNSYNFLYRGDFTGAIGTWDLEINADIKAPNFVNNFFGWGNESVFNQDIDEEPGINADDEIDYYRFRFEEIKLETYMSRKIGNYGTFHIGPAFQRIEVEEPDGQDRYIDEYAATLPYNLYTEFNTYAGVRLGFTVDKRDNAVFTRRGINFTIYNRSMAGLDKRAGDFNSLESSITFYHTFRLPARIVFAARVGGGLNSGDYEFYQAQILDGRTELRGYRKTRFYGDSKFYTNLETRIKLFSMRSYLFPATLGLVAFHDLGRVWYANENSNTWHKGWGGGIWFTPFNLTVVSLEAAHSKEGTLGYVRLGFLF